MQWERCYNNSVITKRIAKEKRREEDRLPISEDSRFTRKSFTKERSPERDPPKGAVSP